MKTIVVLSGGLDSSTALALAHAHKLLEDEIETLTFNYGSKHNEMENKAAKAISNYYGVKNTLVSLDFIKDSFTSDLLKSGGNIPEGHYADESMKSTVVPFRNGIMLSIAAGFAESVGASSVVLGNHFGDHAIYPDCRNDFSEPMRLAIKNGTYKNIELVCPFQNYTKSHICALAKSLKVPVELTYSCYKGGAKHCGKCGTCNERLEAFREAGYSDGVKYE